MIGYRSTLKALLDLAVLKSKVRNQNGGDDIMSTALEITLKLAQRSSSKSLMVPEEYIHARSHDLSHDFAARRVQVTARYALERNRILLSCERGEISESDAKEMLDKQRLEYVRSIHQGTWSHQTFDVRKSSTVPQ